MQSRGLWISLGVLLSILIVGAGLALKGGGHKPLRSKTIAIPTSTPKALFDEGQEAKEVAISAREFEFSPSTVSVKAGEKVILTLNNKGRIPHNLVIDELGVETEIISGGESDSVVFIAEKKGVYSFYCGIGSHRDLGMEGVLTVE